jgi:hypothetical protein
VPIISNEIIEHLNLGSNLQAIISINMSLRGTGVKTKFLRGAKNQRFLSIVQIPERFNYKY